MAATAFAGPVRAQRLSLAERVAKLEQQVNGQGGARGSVELVNQVNALQSQVQALQGQIEELRHQLQGLQQRSKDQYIDLDSRIGRLEGRNAAAPAAPATATSNGGRMQDIQLGSPSGNAAANGSAPASAPDQSPASPTAAQMPAQSQPEQPAQEPASAGTGGQQAAANPPADPQAAYKQAFDALKDGRYAESARLFQAFIGQYPDDALAPNAYYWLGESYYVTENFGVSLDTFRKLIAKYPNSQKAPDALLKIGYCQYEMKQWNQATATLNEVVRKYPGTTVANLAQGRLRAIKLEGQR